MLHLVEDDSTSSSLPLEAAKFPTPTIREPIVPEIPVVSEVTSSRASHASSPASHPSSPKAVTSSKGSGKIFPACCE
ncbi:hypothetical protein C1H46_031975 [Malus baccata]|uniref:Uncharacterized protein n=1 Tax=Malus baccata TaxID=106549 RepID=A0A540L827_MALBA|nr:hypothetical protein C1H46_031975 [Malus baccata]